MQSLQLPNPALSLSAHPTQPILSIGTTESLLIATVQQDQTPKTKHTHPLSSIHSTAFHNDIILASSANEIHTFQTGRPGKVFMIPMNEAEESAESLSITALSSYDQNTFLAGDDQGGVHLIDTRSSKIASTLEQGDYVTALTRISHLGTDTVLSTSGDGTLCAYDIRLPKPRIKLMYATDTFHDDLLSLTIVQNHAVAGTLSGALNVYDLRFLDAEKGDDVRVDRFFGHPECVNAVLTWDDVVVTASSDGYVRVVDVIGRRLLGLLDYDMEKDEGKKRKGSEEETWPVEGMVKLAAWDRPVFALRGHDSVVRLCDGRALLDSDDDDGKVKGGKLVKADAEEEMGKKKRKRRKGIETTSGFFDGL